MWAGPHGDAPGIASIYAQLGHSAREPVPQKVGGEEVRLYASLMDTTTVPWDQPRSGWAEPQTGTACGRPGSGRCGQPLGDDALAVHPGAVA